MSNPLSTAHAAVQQARIDLYTLERSFARWRKKQSKQAAPLTEASAKTLDRWIKKLGDARHRETSSIRELKDLEAKNRVDPYI